MFAQFGKATGDTGMKSAQPISWQVLRRCLIAFAIAFLALIVPSLLSKPRPNPYRTRGTLSSLNAFAQAVEYFEEKYGKLPEIPTLDFETEGPQAAAWITVLLGKEEISPEMQNPRLLVFLTMKISENRRQGGLVMSTDNRVVGAYDYWGNPLRVILRPPGQSTFVVSHLGKQVTISKSAAVLSRGPDQKWGTEDDLMSETEGK
jgi:hypothetical protein